MSSPCRKLTNQVPIACNLSAIPAVELEQHKATAAQLFRAVAAGFSTSDRTTWVQPSDPTLIFS